jgi:hypothetical protein
MEITLTIPEELAKELGQQEDFSLALELGLRELQTKKALGFSSATEVIEILASLPTPQQVLELRPTPALQERLQTLLEK